MIDPCEQGAYPMWSQTNFEGLNGENMGKPKKQKLCMHSVILRGSGCIGRASCYARKTVFFYLPMGKCNKSTKYIHTHSCFLSLSGWHRATKP